MQKISNFFLGMLCVASVAACNNGNSDQAATDSTTVHADSTAASVAGVNYKLGVQMWTFRMFSFADALDKVDSAGIKNIEAFWGQDLGAGMKGKFGGDMTDAEKAQVKELLGKKGISMVAMGVIVPQNKAEWIKAFELAKYFGLSYITSEPIKTQWDMVDSLAGAYGIKVAIHDHPNPNPYWSPDSVLAAIQGHQNLGACADIGHWSRNGLNPVECLKKLEGHIYGGHLKDITKFGYTKAEDTVVSKGVIDIPAVFAELKRQNFAGMLSIEHESNWYHNLPDVIFTKQYFDEQTAKLK
ncbi:sugar phosphate isomerase/epimerase family protein [Chitinophaga sp. Hz27]|uniref:sugar phosphate isomerase/epimerase family protein n=1 Tax=Chitinophaga sp. Hz27 TaxID=3347169 RepID=UPI0035D8525F